MKCFAICLLVIVNLNLIFAAKCERSVTKASGTKAKQFYCSGQLIFEDNFDDGFDLDVWQHENTLAGGGVSIYLAVNDLIIVIREFEFLDNTVERKC